MNLVRLAFIAGVSAVSTYAPGLKAQEGVLATVHFTEVHDRIVPFQEVTTTDHELSARLLPGGQVTEFLTSTSGRHTKSNADSLIVGPSAGRERWRIIARNKLLNVRDFISYRRAILLTVAGRDCTADVAYNLKPGFSDYRYHRLVNGDLAIARSVQASNVSCHLE